MILGITAFRGAVVSAYMDGGLSLTSCPKALRSRGNFVTPTPYMAIVSGVLGLGCKVCGILVGKRCDALVMYYGVDGGVHDG